MSFLLSFVRALRGLAIGGEKARKALLDAIVPVPDGLSTVAGLCRREAAGKRKTPVTVVTAFGTPSDRARVLARGADGYVAKPLEPEALRAELRRVLVQ